MGSAISRIDGYSDIRLLASGGMAEIFFARRLGSADFQKDCVIKRMRPDYRSRREFSEMFLDEARIAASFHHPNLPQVFEVGWDGDLPYYAMEYLQGSDCRQIHRVLGDEGGVIPLEHAVLIAAGAAAGLHYAHFLAERDGAPLKVVHRDVSPSNIFVTTSGSVKVVDFGVALSEQRMTRTTDGALKGKLPYMSPEQLTSGVVDHRSDLFSLGVVLYELCTGRHPFRQEGELGTMNSIAAAIYERPSVRDPAFPGALEAIICRCLAREPGERFSSADDLVAALETYAQRDGVQLSARRLGAFVTSISAGVELDGVRTAVRSAAPQLDLLAEDIARSQGTWELAHDTIAEEPRARRWRPWLGAGLAGVAALLLLSVGIWVWPLGERSGSLEGGVQAVDASVSPGDTSGAQETPPEGRVDAAPPASSASRPSKSAKVRSRRWRKKRRRPKKRGRKGTPKSWERNSPFPPVRNDD